MPSGIELPLAPQRTFGETRRRDQWWLQPLLVFLGLGAFVVYATWAALQGEHYDFGPYLSPFYSPLLFGTAGHLEHAWFGETPTWLISPTILILWGPVGFRFTCYYYRGTYYKAFWADPPNCAVGEPRKDYRGEHKWPLIVQNVHRYFLYVAIAFIFFLGWDAIKAFWFSDGFGIGVGTIVLVLNVVLLAGYTFGCHSFRHLIGGRLDCISRQPTTHKLYQGCTALNKKHGLWAWLSLVWVAFSDVYVRLCSMGIWHDYRLI